MSRRPPKPVPSGSPRVHFDAGAPRPRDGLLDEIRVVWLDPPADEPLAVERVLDVLERILRAEGAPK